MKNRINYSQAEKIALNAALTFLNDNNFDRNIMLEIETDLGGGSMEDDTFYLFTLYKLADEPKDALDFVSIKVNRINSEYEIIPNISPELEKYKKKKITKC